MAPPSMSGNGSILASAPASASSCTFGNGSSVASASPSTFMNGSTVAPASPAMSGSNGPTVPSASAGNGSSVASPYLSISGDGFLTMSPVLPSSSSSMMNALQESEVVVISDDYLDRLWFYGASADATGGRNWESAPCLRKQFCAFAASLQQHHGDGRTQQNQKKEIVEEEQKHCLTRTGHGKLSSAMAMAEKRDLLRQVFDTFDENKDGRLSRAELRSLFDRLGIETTEEGIVSIFKKCGYGGDTEYVTPNEFLFLYHQYYRIPPSPSPDLLNNNSLVHSDEDDDILLSDVFNIFDKNNDGFISPCELQDVLCRLGFAMASELDACVEMICRFDQDGDGLISFVEFKEMLLLDASSSSSTASEFSV